MTSRRQFLHRGGALALTGLAGATLGLGGFPLSSQSAGNDYRALVVLFLDGGNDGNNMLVPTDGGYTDYQRSRSNLALSKNSLLALPGLAGDRSFGMHPALSPLAPLYAQGRLGFIANAGPLWAPATGAQARDNAVELPPFLLSHSDQIAIQQGWTVKDDNSGWAGRALEALPSALRNPLAAVTFSNKRTLVQGKHSGLSFMNTSGMRYWGRADLTKPQTEAAQSLNRMAQWQFANAYEQEYARTMGDAVTDSTLIARSLLSAATPTADFGSGNLADMLRELSRLMPVLKSQGFRRQVFLVQWGSFDTHADQRGSATNSQDTQLSVVAKAMAGFDQALQTAGLGQDVITLQMSDFGRTLRPGSGGGSEHAWGNHWLISGGPVAGGTVHGRFPDLTLGGTDDGDRNRNGRLVPGIATDQVGATLMRWLGLPDAQLLDVFPNLAPFASKHLPLLRT